MARHTGVVMFILGILVVPARALAQAPPAWTSKVKVGAPLFVTMANGDRLEGVAGSVTADGLAVATPAGVRTAAFGEIIRAERRDSSKTGLWIGAGVGAAIGVVAMFTGACPDASAGCREEARVIPIGGALYGGLIGWGIDALVKGRTTIFESAPRAQVSLLTGRGAVGARVAFSW